MLRLEDLYEIHEKYRPALDAQVETFALGDQIFDFNVRSAILGVVNLSKDSKHKESICLTTEQAIRRSIILNAGGADIIDIGSEATGSKAERVEDFKQISMIIPLLRDLHKRGILTSVETYYPQVAKECLQAGANIINLTGSKDSEAIYRLVSEFDAGVIICYLQGGNAREVVNFTAGDDPVELMYEYFAREIEVATRLGVKKIFIDAGFGFEYQNLKESLLRIRYQMKTMLTSFRLRTLGFPICQQLPHAFEFFGEERRNGQLFFAVLALLGKTDLIRTHEVPKIKAVLDTMDFF
ncbi:dihydropteroate synthase [Limnoraphis robusta Tam1]|uniref:dihydropteroate synthase n=1 Tax=Limnoraphis robusta TaxID=1118279 RepID=UPI002B1F4854|nr:dihydropteroate synthase [Limnoraphis robusta]MEA5542449.1 dihydropteroate synthase [Limnoraphis robusta Tam1]